MMHFYKINGGVIATAEPIDADEISSEEYESIKTGIKRPVWTDAMQAQYARTRPFTEKEVLAMLIPQQINSLTVDGNTALRMKQFYPTFESVVGQTVKQGFRFRYGDKLYETLQPELTVQSHYLPGTGTESLYAEVCETHDGTIDDPIPYNGNMALENGKYYVQNYVIYLCNRDTVNPVYNALSELVGLYVIEV